MDTTTQTETGSGPLKPRQSDCGPARDGFLVLGMHRSGTSAIAGTLARLGVTPPKTLMKANEHNQRGYWESVELYNLHQKLLESAGSRWDDVRAFDQDWYASSACAKFRERAETLFESEFGNAAAFVLKDPRICRFPRFWLEIFAKHAVTPRIVLPVRIPLEVAQSLQTTPWMQQHDFSYGLLLWLRHVLDAEEATRHLPRVIVPWSSFLADWRSETTRISDELGVQWPRLDDTTAAEVDRFLSAALKHENVPTETACVHPDMHAWISMTYDAMLEMAGNPASTRAHALLDDVRSRFDEAAAVFSRVINGMEHRVGSLSGELAGVHHLRLQEQEEARRNITTLDHQRAQAVEMQRVHEETLAALQTTLASERQSQEQKTHEQASLLDDERTKLKDLRRTHEDTLDSLQAVQATLADERQLRAQEAARQAQALDESEAKLTRARAELEAVVQHRDVVEASLKQTQEKIARVKERPVRSAMRWLMGRPI